MSAQVLWPNRFSLYELMTKRAVMGPTAFESEYQSNAVDPGAVEWPPEWFAHADLWFTDWPNNLAIKTMGVDSSKGRGTRQSDDSAITLIGRDPAGVLFVDVDSRNDRGAEVITDTVWEYNRVFRPDSIAFETNDFQELFLVLFQQRAKREPEIPVEIFPIENMVNKMVRILRLGTYFSQRLVRFKRYSAGTAKAVQQAKDFRRDPKDHDDILDSLEMGIRRMIQLWNG